MKLGLRCSLLAAAVAGGTSLSAQGGPPPRRPMGDDKTASAPARVITVTITATVQVLSRADVQRELELTAAQIAQMGLIARGAASQNASENSVRTAMLGVLSEAQAARFNELLIQYMGYGSLIFSDVRAKLQLSDEQQSALNQIVAAVKQAKQKGGDVKQAEVNQQLAKVLTAEQDAALRKLAGKPLGS